jgi:hypothetical protein
VAAHYVQLQFACLRGLNAFRGKAPDTRRYSVDSLFSPYDLFYEFAGLRHRLTGTWREPDSAVIQHHLVKIAPTQIVSGELQIARHQTLTKTENRKSKNESRRTRLVASKGRFSNFAFRISTFGFYLPVSDF